MTNGDLGEDIRLRQIEFTFGNENEPRADQCLRDVLEEMFAKDKKLVPIRGTSPQIHMRPAVTNWLQDVAARLSLLRKTLFLGVYLFDRFTDRHDVAAQQIHLVALVCLHLAAKLEETEGSVPKTAILRRFLPRWTDDSVTLFLGIEKLVLKFFKFQLLFPTVIDFFEYFILFAVEFAEIQIPADFNNNLGSKEEVTKTKYFSILNQISDASSPFLNIILRESAAGTFRPSVLAAAAIMVGRLAVGLSSWSEQLDSVFLADISLVDECIIQLWPELLLQERSVQSADDDGGRI